MGGFLQVTLLFSLCIALCLGVDYELSSPQYPHWKLVNPVRVVSNVPGVTLKRVGVATTTCSTYLVTLDDSPTNCLKFYDQDGNFQYSNCNQDLLDAHDMYFYASAGYVFTPDGRFVIVDMYTGGIIDTVGANQTGAPNPWMCGVFSNFAVPTARHTYTLIDKDVNSTAWNNNWDSTDGGYAPFTANNTYTHVKLASLENTEPITCMFSSSANYYQIVTQGANYTQAWDNKAPGAIGSKITGFGEIGACGGDFYSRMWFWDKSDSKIKVVSETGRLFFEQELPEVVNPVRIFPSRNKVYIQDQNGVMRYDLPKLTITPQIPTVTCSKSTISVTLNGGSGPYKPRLVPDYSNPNGFSGLASGNISGTFAATYTDLYDRPFTIYDDVFALEYTALPKSGPTSVSAINSNVVAPHSGANVWSMLMIDGSQYGVIPNPDIPGASISAANFHALEMWIYVNPTVGRFQIDIPPLSFVYNISDIPRETWHKLTFDLTLTTPTTTTTAAPTYNRILFTDLSINTTSNPFIFVDAIRAIPYPSTDRKIAVYDSCDVYTETPYLPFADRSSVFRAEVASPSVSCNAAGSSGNKASDAVFNAVVTGGVRPYSYTWTLPAGPVYNVSIVRSQSASDNYLSLYDNSLSADFIDYSNTPVSYSDSTYNNSAPYSLSFEPSGSVLNDLVYFIAGGISTAKYKSVEFYINGGQVGGQIIRIGLLSSQLTFQEAYVHKVAAQPAIRANFWTKVTYPIPSSTSTYYGFVFTGIVGNPQPRVYIDDIKFITNTQRLEVRDATGTCSVSTNIFVLQPRVVAATSIVSNVKCYESTDGVITLNVNGGSGIYNYNWLNSTSQKKDYTLSGLSQGTFAVQVSDTNNCTTIPLVTRVSVLRPPAITLIHNTEHSKCAGSSGTIVAKVHGGIPPYYYRWSSPTGSFFDALAVEAPYAMFSDSLQNGFILSPNTYTSILCLGNTDLSSHTGYCSLSVVPPANNTGVVLFGIGCPNCFDFSLYTAVKLWVRVTRGGDIPKLHAGLVRGNETVYSQPLFNYTTTSTEWQEVIITFPNDFDSADYFRIANSGSSVVDFLIDSMSLIPIGTFSKGLNVASGFIAVVEALGGDFTLSLRDSNGCPVDYSFTVNEPAPLSVTFSFQAPNETSGDSGRVYAQASGGVGGYSYFWPELNQYSQSAEYLEAGTYSVVVTDANGCVLNSSALLPFSVRTIRKYTPGVATGFGVILAIGVILTFTSLAILATKWSHFAHYGPFYCVIINVGVLVSYISVAVVIPKPTDALCILFPWFLGIGFTLVYGCLFIKTWVLYRVFRKASQMKKTNLTPFYILKVLSFFMAIEVIFMIVWTVVDPPKAAYADLVDNEREIQCTNKHDTFWIIFLAYKGAWIIFGAILAFLTRNISEEYNESKSIAYAIYNDIVLIVIGIILALTLAQVPSGVVIVEAAIVFLSFTFTMLILFFPIWWKIFFSSVDLADMKLPPRSGGGSSGGSGGNSGGPVSANSKASFSVNTANSQNTHSSRMDVYTL